MERDRIRRDDGGSWSFCEPIVFEIGYLEKHLLYRDYLAVRWVSCMLFHGHIMSSKLMNLVSSIVLKQFVRLSSLSSSRVYCIWDP